MAFFSNPQLAVYPNYGNPAQNYAAGYNNNNMQGAQNQPQNSNNIFQNNNQSQNIFNNQSRNVGNCSNNNIFSNPNQPNQPAQNIFQNGNTQQQPGANNIFTNNNQGNQQNIFANQGNNIFQNNNANNQSFAPNSSNIFNRGNNIFSNNNTNMPNNNNPNNIFNNNNNNMNNVSGNIFNNNNNNNMMPNNGNNIFANNMSSNNIFNNNSMGNNNIFNPNYANQPNANIFNTQPYGANYMTNQMVPYDPLNLYGQLQVPNNLTGLQGDPNKFNFNILIQLEDGPQRNFVEKISLPQSQQQEQMESKILQNYQNREYNKKANDIEHIKFMQKKVLRKKNYCLTNVSEEDLAKISTCAPNLASTKNTLSVRSMQLASEGGAPSNIKFMRNQTQILGQNSLYLQKQKANTLQTMSEQYNRRPFGSLQAPHDS